MKTNPRPWVERYLNNNWAFQDDDNSLFKYRYFSSAIQSMWDINAVRTIGNDVARSGTDRSVIALWAGNSLIDIFIVKDKTQKITTDEQALTLIKYMTENAVVAENIAIDAVTIS